MSNDHNNAMEHIVTPEAGKAPAKAILDSERLAREGLESLTRQAGKAPATKAGQALLDIWKRTLDFTEDMVRDDILAIEAEAAAGARADSERAIGVLEGLTSTLESIEFRVSVLGMMCSEQDAKRLAGAHSDARRFLAAHDPATRK